MTDLLTERFQTHRDHLRSVAYRMLGSLSEADDAVQETWLRLHRSDTSEVANLGGWLTTVVGRICLDMLRSRRSRREEPLDVRLPDPIVSVDPEQEVVQADEVGLALLVVLDTLAPAERLAFVLHDMFAVAFDEIAAILDRSAAAARQLASRARRRVEDSTPPADPDLARQREVVDAWLAASRAGEFDALLALLDPDVVLRADGGAVPGLSKLVRGPAAVVEQARTFAALAASTRPVLVNGAIGHIVTVNGRPVSIGTFTVANGKITAMYFLADPDRLARLALPAPGN